MEFIPNPHKIEHPAGTHMLDNQSRITLWQTEPTALLYAQMLQGCLREYAGLAQGRGTASACIGCGRCERHCPQHIGIIRALQQVAQALENV